MLKRSLMVLALVAGCAKPVVEPPTLALAGGMAPQQQGKSARELAALAGMDFEAPDLGLGSASASTRTAAEQELLRAREHQRGNEHLHALERFAAAARLAPDWAPAIAGLASGLAGVRQEGKALRAFERALVLNPGAAELRFEQADLLLRMGQRAEARAAFGAVLGAEPEHARAHGRLARLWFLSGDLPRARMSAQLAADGGEVLPARLQALVTEGAPR